MIHLLYNKREVINMKTGEIIKKRRKELGLSADDLAERLGVNRTTVFRWERGDIEKLPMNALEPISELLNVSVSYLMGWEDDEDTEARRKIANLFRPASRKRVPLVGRVACGEPILAEEHIEQYVDTDDAQADLALTATGDSMIGARIYDGDTVFIHGQPEVENGEIAVVLIGDEATLKRVRYDEERKELSLYPENPSYKTMHFVGEELNRVRILGKVVAVQFRPR